MISGFHFSSFNITNILAIRLCLLDIEYIDEFRAFNSEASRTAFSFANSGRSRHTAISDIQPEPRSQLCPLEQRRPTIH